MANLLIAFPLYGNSAGLTVPVKALDNGDGTFSLATASEAEDGATIAPTTNLLSGDGAGNGVSSGIAANTVLTKTGNGSGLTNLPAQVIAGSFSGTGTATTAFVVTIGVTMANTTYKVNVTPTAALAAAVFYVTTKSTTQFTVTYLAGLTGTVSFDWAVFP